MVQTLLVLLKKPPISADKRCLVLGTTSVASHLEDLQIVQGFNVTLNIPQVGREGGEGKEERGERGGGRRGSGVYAGVSVLFASCICAEHVSVCLVCALCL